MPTDKFDFEYDSEYDVLFIHNKVLRSAHGIEWGDLDISYDARGKLVNLGINNASVFLTNLTRKKVSKETLAQMTKCSLDTKEKNGLVYINFKFYVKNKPAIQDTITIKSLNHCSPIAAKN